MARWMAYQILAKNSSPSQMMCWQPDNDSADDDCGFFRKPRHLKAAGEGRNPQMRKAKKGSFVYRKRGESAGAARGIKANLSKESV